MRRRRRTGITHVARSTAPAAPDDAADEKRCREALARLGRGDFEGARQRYLEAVQQGTRNMDAYNNLGVLCAKEGQLDQAISLFETGLDLAPAHAGVVRNLTQALEERGLLRHRAGDLNGAAIDLGRRVELGGASPEAENNLGVVLSGLGRLGDAARHYRRAVALDPQYPLALGNLGALLLDCGALDEATDCLERAHALAPHEVELLVDLAMASFQRGALGEALALLEKALHRSPRHPDAHQGLGQVLWARGEVEDGIRHLRAAVARAPERASLHSTLLHALVADPALSPSDVAAEHLRFEAEHIAAWPPLPVRRPAPISGRPLRVGYLSPALRAGPVAAFLAPLVAAHDREQVEVYCYCDSAQRDATTVTLKRLADGWRPVFGLPDERLAAVIAEDQIDVLVDLVGHGPGTRASLFARRAAPLQVSYLGAHGTTGLAAMDLRLTDAVADPPGLTEALHAERLVRIEGGFLCFTPPPDPRPVTRLPAAVNGFVTFGSLLEPGRLNGALLVAWARLLATVPGTELRLWSQAFEDPAVERRARRPFEARGVAPDRLLCALPPPPQDHAPAFDTLDVFLDPFPWNGTLTTCEALWQGVPVVTLAGGAHAGRVGASLLASVGLPELVAAGVDDYVLRAASLAGAPDRLAALRETLRERLCASPLLDPRRLARALEAIFRRELAALTARR